MPLPGVGIVSTVPDFGLANLAPITAAIGHQVVHDLGPAWGLAANVQAFETTAQVPADYGTLLVTESLSSAFFGLHKTKDKRFIGFVGFTPESHQWAVFASHEVIEMLLDPDGKRTAMGPHPTEVGQQVEYLVEPCDPIQDPAFAYTIDAIPVSNFCLPGYYALGNAGPASFRPGLNAPFSIADGGYVTFRDPTTGQFFTTERIGGALQTKSLGKVNPINGSLRAGLDRLRPEQEGACTPAGKRFLHEARKQFALHRADQRKAAKRLHAEIRTVQHRKSR